jgi:Protein tyrosine/serine phosphatase
VYQKKFSIVVIIAIAAIAVVVTKIVLGNSSASKKSTPTAASASDRETPPDDKSAEVTVTLPLFHRLDENYMRGSQPMHGGVETIRRLGAKTIVDLRSIYDHTDELGVAAERAGIRYYWLPMSVWNPPTDKQAKEFVSVVTDKSKGPFYVFCFDGLNRTGEMSAIYRIAEHKWSVEQALKEMDEMGFNPYYYTLRNYVWTYARKFQPSAVPQNARRLSPDEF